jgi:hypothetical protein
MCDHTCPSFSFFLPARHVLYLSVIIRIPACPSLTLPARHNPISFLPVLYSLLHLPVVSPISCLPVPLLYLSVINRFPAFLPVPYFTCPSLTFPGPCLSFHSSYSSSSLPSPSSSAVGVVQIAVPRGLSRDTCLICPANAIAIPF